MVNFRFDLQMFAGEINKDGAPSSESYQTVKGTWVKTSETAMKAGDELKAYFNNGIYYVENDDTMVATGSFSGTVTVVTFEAQTATAPTVPNMKSSAGTVKLSGTNGFTTTTTGATVTVDSDAVTSSTETNTATGLTVVGDLAFKNYSGVVSNAEYAMTLSGATVTLHNDSDANINNLTAGSISTDNKFNTGTNVTEIAGAEIIGAATVSTSDDGTTYSIVSNGAHSIDLGDGEHAFDVKGTESGDTIISGTAGAGTTIDGAGGNDDITLAITTTKEIISVNGGSGNDTITSGKGIFGGAGSYIGGGDGNDKIDLSDADSEGKDVTVEGGVGNDVILASDKVTYSTLSGGDGNDSIRSNAASNVVSLGAGNDTVDVKVNANAANISDYVFGEDWLAITGADESALIKNAAALHTAKKLKSDGTTGIIEKNTTNGDASITSSAGYYAVGLVEETTRSKLGLAWVGDNAVTIDGSSQALKLILDGTTNSAADLLVGGSKADTIYAGESDSVYGGAGADSISIASKATNVYVGVGTASGKDTVAGFAAGFDENTADTIYMVDGSVNDVAVSVQSGTTTFSVGKGSLTVDQGDANAIGLLVNGAKVYAIAEGKNASVSDSDSEAAFYVGSGAGGGVDYSKYGDALMVDLSQESFQNINSVKGGTSDTSLMGSAGSETLMAGTGGASLYGGAGKDVLVGNTSAKDEIFFTTGAGKDTVNSFTAGTGDTSDVLNFMGAGITGASRTSGTQFNIKLSNSDSLTVNSVSGKADEKIQWVSGDVSGVAKIGSVSGANSFTYESDVTAYFGGNKRDTLAVSDSDDHNIWLDGSQGGAAYVSIDVVNAANATGNLVIAGDTASQSISGGRGASSLWGGAGNAADTLSGNNSGTDMFWYGLGEGKDVLQNVGVEDTVNLFNINLANLTGAEIGNSSVAIKTTTGDTLTVNRTSGAATTTFQLADGSTWNANYSSKTWEQA